MRTVDPLSRILAALADPTRRAIVERLAQGEATVNTLAEPLNMSLPGVSKHLRILQEAGLVIQSRDAQRRPCRLNAHTVEQVSLWAEQFRRTWEERFDQLDDYLGALDSRRKK